VTLGKRPPTTLRGRVAILSPHLDDAVYSLGAAISESSRSGADVSLITVFAGDPNSSRPASEWDRRFGFRLAGEAARARRKEDRRACALLGAVPVWLPFDDQYGRSVEDDQVWNAIRDAVGQADTVLVPGFPLDHEDHVRLAQLALAREFAARRLAFYVEQPYAAVRGEAPSVVPALASLVDREPDWHALPTRVAARWRKVRAWRAYRSQFRHFGTRSLANVMRYEARHGGEMVGGLPGSGFGTPAE
jgi:LmbE family N-acetylglucosaminyl deacetylase